MIYQELKEMHIKYGEENIHSVSINIFYWFIKETLNMFKALSESNNSQAKVELPKDFIQNSSSLLAL